LLILKKLDDLEAGCSPQVQTNNKLDELLDNKQWFVTPELERAIKNVSVLAASIDRKVPDKG
jgi:hypothetical protein